MKHTSKLLGQTLFYYYYFCELKALLLDKYLNRIFDFCFFGGLCGVSRRQLFNDPFMLQTVCSTVRGVLWWWNCLPGHPILSELFTLGRVICSYRHSAKHSCSSTTVRDWCMKLCHSGKTSIYLHSSYVVTLPQKTTESQPYIHREPHLQLP